LATELLKTELRTDVAVIGAGPAGLAAAVAAATAGARVCVIDENVAPGGQIWRRTGVVPTPAAERWRERAARLGVEFRSRTAVVDAAAADDVFLLSPEGVLRLRAGALVLATGARELFLPFPGWTLPGVTGAGGLQALVKGGTEIHGQRVVVAGSGPLLIAVAATLRARGARIVALAEQAGRARVARFGLRLLAHPGKLAQGAGYGRRLLGVPKLFGSWPVRAHGERGLERVTLRHGSRERVFECDYLACGFGLVPNVEVGRLLGCALAGDGLEVDRLQRTTIAGVLAAGEVSGIGGVDAAIAEGTVAGCAAAGDTAGAAAAEPLRDRERAFAIALSRAFALDERLAGIATADTVLCRCEDATVGQVRGCTDARDAKLQARCGMGACQARVCGPAARFLMGWAHDRPRPPLVPVPVEVLEAIGAALATDASAAPGPDRDADASTRSAAP
jgi:NADPH-dependent 2,4-dienoyl-CoA reductase/sulfur reductase-like enzyme